MHARRIRPECSGLVAAAAGAFLLKLVTWMLVKLLLLRLATPHRAPAAAEPDEEVGRWAGAALGRAFSFIQILPFIIIL